MDQSTQQGVAMALIGLAGTAFGLLASTIRDRDKLKYDLKLVALSTQNETQAKQIADLTKNHARCEEQHAATERRIDELVAALAGSKSHVPLKE
jgi:septal ring factor EnvC (AmiA/AmiB activator)